eukprot:14440541-Ditylum_brightwellii.AAC.1
MRQIAMGDAKDFTDLTFIPICTLPFELRSTNIILLDKKGNVVNDNPNFDVDAATNDQDA